MKKIGVILSGCGVFDGTEIHESVLTLLSIDRAGAQAVCMAPNTPQFHVINHLTGQATEETRNVLVESARIARGQIEDLAGVTPGDFDGLILPGGYGAAKNLCNFAIAGAQFQVHPEVERVVRATHQAGKPIGFICISPVIAARILGQNHVEVTIGNDRDTAAVIEACGARHIDCTVRDIHVDYVRKVISTPAYMLGRRINEVAEGIDKLVRVVVELCHG